MGLDPSSGTGLLKDGTTLADGVDEAVLKNIGAARQLAEIVRTSLGPNGRKKLVINHLGKTLVSSDCATIVRELEVVHPAAKMLAMAAGAQASEIGDGTNLVVSLAGELLSQAEELLREGLHTSEIVRGYELAYEHCKEILPTLSIDELQDIRHVEKTAATIASVVGSKHQGLEMIFAHLVAEACEAVAAPKPNKPFFKTDQVRVAKIKGGDAMASHLVHGMILPRNSETNIKSCRNAKVAVIGCGIEASQTETKGTVLLRNADDLLNYNKTEERAIEKMIKEIADAGIQLIFCNGSISEMARHFLEKYQIMVLRVPSKFDMRRVCAATNAHIMVRVGAPTPEETGFLAKIDITEIGGRTCCILDQSSAEDTHESKVATIVIRSSTASLLDDLERAVDHGVMTVRALARDGRLVHGAGACEAQLASKLRSFGKTCHGLEQYAVLKFADAFECVPRALAENAGADATQVVADLRTKHDAGQVDAHVPALRDDNYIDANSAPPVFDCLAVKESAIRLAVDAAITVLRVDQLIMSKPAGGPKPPPQGAPDA